MTFSFGVGLSALSAARFAIQTIGNNLANATTDGYTRQRVVFGSAVSDLQGSQRIGGGVQVESLQRVTDDLLLRRVRSQQQEVSRRDVVFQHLQSIELALGGLGDQGISAQVTGYFNSLSQLATSPDDGALRNGTIQEAVTLSELIRGSRREIGTTRKEINLEIDRVGSEVNRLAGALADVNRNLSGARAQGEVPPELLNAQDRLLDELSQLVDIQVQDVGFGRKNVTIGGQMIVSYGTHTDVGLKQQADGTPALFVSGGSNPVDLQGGKIKGLLDLVDSTLDKRQGELDTFARGLILSTNRLHSTGVPASGGFSRLDAEHRIVDSNGTGYLDEPLANAGLPFDITDGRLHLSVRNDATGEVEQTTIDISTNTTTVGDFVNAINTANGINATIDSAGRLSITADTGKRFHFAAAVDPNPDAEGIFGSGNASIASTGQEPFALTPGSALDIAIDGGPPTTVTFAAGQFADITQATADEVAAAINTTLVGGTARAVDGRVVIESNSQGAASQVLLSDSSGTPTADLGLSTTADFGNEIAVSVGAGGSFTGDTDEVYTFRPLSDGTIGVTPGLQVEVRNSAGTVVATLDVGDSYSPGKDLDLVNGLTISFDAGNVSATSGDVFSLNAVADGDSADVLVAFGLNSFFSGSDAETIGVNEQLVADPSLLAQGLGNGASDNRNLVRLLDLREAGVSELGDSSIEEYFSQFVADVGLETARAATAVESETLLLQSFSNRLEQIRGVSVDEELANLQRFEQSYQAAARYIAAINEVTQVLFSI